MADKSKGFLLVFATRSSGAPYWVVRGTVGGRQLRREFSDRSEALRYQEPQNSIAQGVEAAHAAVTTRLAPDQVHDAEVVPAQLAREFPDISLHAVMDHYRATAPVLPPAEAARFADFNRPTPNPEISYPPDPTHPALTGSSRRRAYGCQAPLHRGDFHWRGLSPLYQEGWHGVTGGVALAWWRVKYPG